MDLERLGLRGAANGVLNRYLWRTDPRNIGGVAALPLFMALRAGIRAMVEVHRGAGNDAAPGDVRQRAESYLDTAIALMAPSVPCVVAVGGLSGSEVDACCRTAPRSGSLQAPFICAATSKGSSSPAPGTDSC